MTIQEQMTTTISYFPTDDAWEGYRPFIQGLIDTYAVRSACDIGGGANPVLGLDYIQAKQIDYTILDISAPELAKAPGEYHKIQADIAAPDFAVDATFDLVFSQMLAEHVEDAEQFHRNTLSVLNRGGVALHFFPTLYALPFLVNCWFPERLAAQLLKTFDPRDDYQYAKFPAYYRWCRGPLRSQIKKFEALGYEVVEYRGFFGHSGYYKRIKPVQMLHNLKTDYLLKHPQPWLTSYAYIVLRKV